MSISSIKGATVPVEIWAPLEEVESVALDQLRNIASLPWVFKHVAAMPDVHYGKGATVGSVIAMKNAVSPAAVGVDLGCVDMDTEYLSPTGWVKLSEYTGGSVMQYDPHTGVGEFVDPTAYIVKKCPEFLHLRTKYGVNQMLSPDHRVLCWKITGRDRTRVMTVMSAREFRSDHTRLVQGLKAEFKTTFTPKLHTSIGLSDNDIRVQVMVNADANLSRGTTAVIRLKKSRKIVRARKLLSSSNIEFTEKEAEDGVTTIRFSPPLKDKSFRYFWGSSASQLLVIAEECLLWDGNSEEKCFYTRSKESADFIQYAFTTTGKRAVLRTDKHYRDGKDDYRVFAQENTMVGVAGSPKSPINKVPSEDGKAYCFTVPSGFWVMRRGGNIAMTGNCGMAAVRTNLTASDLPDSLDLLRHRVEKEIPVGFNSHDRVVKYAEKHSLWKDFHNLTDKVQDRLGKARKQMGTLGGGNHFIELCLDTEQNVWLMLHSGSRNIGKTLADIHIGRARKMIHNAKLPDKDLAVFLAGTKEMAEYRRDLFWAQRYAKANREVMLKIYMDIITKMFKQARFETPISCHHNYVSEEVHFDEEVMVTRKGAISARLGELGIIPGSMGTKSYIVSGLGCAESFNSASRGAGRRMSRGAAKRLFTQVDIDEQTAGVCCRKDMAIRDELPGAYKDIDKVMENQKDLVEVVAELKQIMCVKG